MSIFCTQSARCQSFVTPELPLSKTVDGQIYGSIENSVIQERFVQGRVDPDRQLQGRVIEGRVLTGQNGQLGDMTLRFPDSADSTTSNDNGAMVFGPIDIDPLPAIPPQQITGPSQRQNQQISSPDRRRPKPDLREIPNREIIRQRYPDGNVQIARHVMQDAEGNWVNDGQWKLFDQQGAMIAAGSYRHGAMEGKWSRLHTAGSGGIFSNVPFIEFDGPYASHANFESGKLSGPWIIQDRKGQKILEIPYKDGRRNGVAVWYLPEGRIHRRMEFADGVPVGKLVEYDNQGKIRRKETYKDGMKIVNNVTYYRPSGQKRQESIVQRGRLALQGEDDWWEAKPAPMIVTGQDVQHGPVRSWFENGQTKMVGNLVKDKRVGKFIWWHRNGTKQLTGQYDEAGNKTGRWRWWHENGIKSIDGSYTDGEAAGPWQWWNEQGKLINEEDFDKSDVLTMTSEDPSNDEGSERYNPDDAFGEDPDQSSILDDGEAVSVDAGDRDSGGDRGDIDNDIDTDDLEGIEPESFEGEEMPEPRDRQMPAVLRESNSDSQIEAFFQIQDDQ
jgi:antitoxin component YwqK of YwqJK toxin-antitoxin module